MSIVRIGMDVHKNSFKCNAIDYSTGKTIAEKVISPDPDEVIRFRDEVRKISDYSNAEFTAGYESGCLGYHLQREIEERGLECRILATSTIKSSTKNAKMKTDRRDARMIAEAMCDPATSYVHVPTQEDEDMIDKLRMLDDAKDDLKRNKQRIKALLLRKGVRTGVGQWSQQFIKWLRELDLGANARRTLDDYLIDFDRLTDKISRIEDELEELSHGEKYEENISRLRCFKGIDTTAAMIVYCNTCDFSRFPTANSYASYVGLIPSTRDSGDHYSSPGITKMGNKFVRRQLIESAHTLVRGKIGQKGKRVRARQKNQDLKVIEYADRAVERLQRKYHRLIERGLPVQKAVVAVARELACFVWGMSTGHIEPRIRA